MMDYSPLFISLKIALIATFCTFFAGILLAYGVGKLRRGAFLVDAVIMLPMVLPPTVIGFFLLLLLGKRSLIGELLFNSFDFSIVFTPQAAVIAAFVVSLPLMYRTARGAFEQLDQNIVAAARTLGVSEWRIFWRLILPNSWQGILAGTILAFTRAVGEFGATIMFAGNVPGKTQTMSVAIYAAVQANDYDLAKLWAIIIVIFSVLFLFLLNLTNRRTLLGSKHT